MLQTQRLRADRLEEPRLEHDVEHSLADRHRQRIATEGRAVRAGRQALRGIFGRETAPTGKPPPMPLAIAMMSGVMPAHSWANSLPVRPIPVCTSSSTSNRPASVAQLAERTQKLGRGTANAALALDRLDHDGCRLRSDRGFDSGDIAERDVIEARDLGPEALQVLLVAAGGDGGERAAMEGAAEGDDAPPLGMPGDEMIAPRGLDRALAGLGSRIAEEDLVGKGRRNKPLSQPLLAPTR